MYVYYLVDYYVFKEIGTLHITLIFINVDRLFFKLDEAFKQVGVTLNLTYCKSEFFIMILKFLDLKEGTEMRKRGGGF